MYKLNPPNRILLGPGPSDAHPETLQAQALPLIGHMDPAFIEIMNEVAELLREMYGTENKLTMPISATGSAGMETVFVNLIEPGDKALICVNGLFGERMTDVAARAGAEVTRVEAPWGQAIDPAQVAEAVAKDRFKMVAVVHAETSTGVKQPLEEIARIAHDNGALFAVDCVTSIGGIPIEADKVGIDAAYAGTQKCLSAPPGLSPVTFNDRAVDVIMNRKTKIQSWYLDLSMIAKYWGGATRAYHHTAPISSVYAIHAALRLIHEEGLENVFARHATTGLALQKGLEAMGLKLLVENPDHRLPELTTFVIPEGIEDGPVRSRLLNEYGIEIGGGLGVLAGKIWRIGLMGHSCRKRNVMLVLAALETVLSDMGYGCDKGAALAAAEAVFAG
ncbi:MAG: alanine--glyoxylate aminotransferase family protein [Clostridia bacterium]|jgi:alanine-glyoxylate transaminase/serine-glyoxylate transaminase/serine-pyruvate transaminase|nr:alanine--glyoxylate aminotransferase family protein [Clostridia bacterium]